MRVYLIAMCIFFSHAALAFEGLVHEQIIKSAFNYIDKNPKKFPVLLAKIKSNKKQVQSVLIRSAIDVDFMADLWMSAWYVSPFAGGKTKTFGMLSSLFHFLNVTKPGEYWKYDGYAYKNTEGEGNDAYLGVAGMKVRGDLSFPLGGKIDDTAKKSSMVYLGDYKQGFKGSDEDWQEMYFDGAKMSKAVLPPCYVPAQKAYELFVDSNVASESKKLEWDANLSIRRNYLFAMELEHTFANEQIKGLPVHLDKMGITLHMIHDLAVPHHALGLAGSCHTELEDLVDTLACGEKYNFGADAYEKDPGKLRKDRNCQELYEPLLVKKLLSENSKFKHNKNFNIPDFFVAFAKQSAKWKFGKLNQDKIAMRLPSNKLFSGHSCNILDNVLAYRQIVWQYNYAVAATVFLLENAFLAREKKIKS